MMMPFRKTTNVLLTIVTLTNISCQCMLLPLTSKPRSSLRASKGAQQTNGSVINHHVGYPLLKLRMKIGQNAENSEEVQKQGEEQDKSPSWNSSLRRLAELSLEDYEWRTSVFKAREADRLVEESVARIMGDEASYVRPMDASEKSIGPLGRAEKSAVQWLKDVIDEEGRRARQIVNMEGSIVRPKDSTSSEGELGPLGFMEQQVVDFLNSIRTSEQERARTKILRPKDMDESMRGPLGKAELVAVSAIREVLESERVRVQQSRISGEIVRPIDVPGPLGEFEMSVLEVIKAEQQRKVDGKSTPGSIVRPKDSTLKGPLGKLEQQAVEVVQRLTSEEKMRLRNIQRTLDENRPMENDRFSLLGVIEALIVGIVRAPILLFQIVLRVSELLASELLDESDAKVLERQRDMEDKSSSDAKKK